MIAGFFTAMFSGHLYVIAIVTGIQIVSFKEVIAIANVPSRAKNLRFTRSLNWYFLGTTMYFLYGENVIYYFKHIVLVDKVLLPFATHHRFISFMLYVIGTSSSRGSLPAEVGGEMRDWLDCRFCLLCWLSPERPLPLPIYPVRLDAHGSLPDRRTSPFYNEQHFRGDDLVLPPSIPGYYQWHFRLHMWYCLRSYPAHQAFT